MKPDITGPLFNPEHRGYKVNSYNAYKCELWEFDRESTQTDLSNLYAAVSISISAQDDSTYNEYNSFQHSRSLYRLFKKQGRRKQLAALSQTNSQLVSTIVFYAV